MKRYTCLSLAILFVMYFSTAAFAQSGSLDVTFGNAGFVATSVNYNTTANWANSVVVQPDDKIVVAAEVFDGSNPSMARNFYVLRYDPNGTLDPTFGTGGVATFAFTAAGDREDPYSLALQPDGKILVGGVVASTGSVAGVARLNADGSLDATFGTGGMVTFVYASKEDGNINEIQVQANGRIVVGGTSSGKFGFARLNANGTFDTTFNGTGKLSVSVSPQKSNQNGGLSSLVIQPDGKYLASGLSGSGPRQPQSWMLMRLNANGTLDSSFGSGGQVVNNLGGTWSVARNVRVLANGKILAGGDVLVSPYSTWTFIRYLSNGQIDTTFGSGGKFQMAAGGSSRIEGMAVQADGKIVGGGWWRNVNLPGSDVMIMRLNSNGTADSGFGTNGFTITDYNGLSDEGHAMSMQSDGKFVLAGIINGYANSTASIGLYRYLP